MSNDPLGSSALPLAKRERTRTATALAYILRAIEQRRGLSLIRLGDGEARILGYPKLTNWDELDQTSLAVWFGHDHCVSEQEVLQIRMELRAAIRAADIVGLPRQWQVDTMPEWRRVMDVCAEYELVSPATVVVDTAMHHYLHFSRAYQAILAGRKCVGLVTCRDIATKLAAIFAIDRVEQYLIPAEADFPGRYFGRHFPHRFNELRSALVVPEPGTVFLVGAGALGKIYCHWIKQRGGVALDVGSIFDAWSDVHSRGRFARFPDQFLLNVYKMHWPMTEREIEARVEQSRRLMAIV